MNLSPSPLSSADREPTAAERVERLMNDAQGLLLIGEGRIGRDILALLAQLAETQARLEEQRELSIYRLEQWAAEDIRATALQAEVDRLREADKHLAEVESLLLSGFLPKDMALKPLRRARALLNGDAP